MVLVCIPCWSEGLSRCLLLLFFTLDYEHTSTPEHILAQKLNNRVFEFLVKNLLSYMFSSFTVFLSIFFFSGFSGQETFQSYIGRNVPLFLGLTRMRGFQNRGEKKRIITLSSFKGAVSLCKTRAAVFYRDLKPRGAVEWF